jgi:hypothetical protein
MCKWPRDILQLFYIFFLRTKKVSYFKDILKNVMLQNLSFSQGAA